MTRFKIRKSFGQKPKGRREKDTAQGQESARTRVDDEGRDAGSSLEDGAEMRIKDMSTGLTKAEQALDRPALKEAAHSGMRKNFQRQKGSREMGTQPQADDGGGDVGSSLEDLRIDDMPIGLTNVEQALDKHDLEDTVKCIRGLFPETFTTKAGDGNNVAKTIAWAMRELSKVAPPPLNMVLTPLGEMMGQVYKQALVVIANKKKAQQLAERIVDAVRIMNELVLCIRKVKDKDPSIASRMIVGDVKKLEEKLRDEALPFLKQFCDRGYVEKLFNGKSDQEKFEGLDKGIVELLNTMNHAVGREGLLLTTKVYDVVEETLEISRETNTGVKKTTDIAEDNRKMIKEMHGHMFDGNTPRTSGNRKNWLLVAIDPPPNICVPQSRIQGVNRQREGILAVLKQKKHILQGSRNREIQFSDSVELQTSVGGSHIVLWLSLGINYLKESRVDDETEVDRVKKALENRPSGERPALFVICMKYGAQRVAKALASLSVPVIWIQEDLVTNRGLSLSPGAAQFRYVAEEMVPTLHNILAGRPPLKLECAAVKLRGTAHGHKLKERITGVEESTDDLPQAEYIVLNDEEFSPSSDSDEDCSGGNVKELLCEDVKYINSICKRLEESENLRLHLVGGSPDRLLSVAQHVLEAPSLERKYMFIRHFNDVDAFKESKINNEPTLVWLDLYEPPSDDNELPAILKKWKRKRGNLAVVITMDDIESDWNAGVGFSRVSICTGDGECSPVSKVHDEFRISYQFESNGERANLNCYKRYELTGTIHRAIKSKYEELFLSGVFEGDEEGELILRVWMTSIKLLKSLGDDILSNKFAIRLTEEAQKLVPSEECRPSLGRGTTARLADDLTGALKDLPPSSSSEGTGQKIGTTGEPSTTQEAQELVSSEKCRPGLEHASTARLAGGLTSALQDLLPSNSSEAAEQKIDTTEEPSTTQKLAPSNSHRPSLVRGSTTRLVGGLTGARDDSALVGSSEDGKKSDTQRLRVHEKLEVKVDLTAFAESYESSILRLDKLTPHQKEKLSEAMDLIEKGQSLHIKAPAGAGKTFVALHLILKMLRPGPVLFVTRASALCYFLVNWLMQRLEGGDVPVDLGKQLHVLHAPFEEGPKTVNLDKSSDVIEFVPFKASVQSTLADYTLVVVDEAHHVYNDPKVADIRAYISGSTPLLLLSDLSQSNDRCKVNFPNVESVVELTEVVRSSKRIISAASAFQNKAEGHSKGTTCAHQSRGPPLKTFLFDIERDTAREAYAKWTLEAINGIRNDFKGLSLHGRLAIVVRDGKMRDALKEDMAEKLKADGLELVSAERSCAAYIRSSQAEKSGKEWLLLDTVDNVDGLERLIVICVGLDTPIEGNSDELGTRSQLYRAITRAHMQVVVVNELLPNGWLTFLAKVRLKGDTKFDEDEALSESLQATERAEAEAARQKKLEEDAKVAFEELGRNAEVDIGLLLPHATALMRAGQSANAAVMQAFKQWQLDQDLATLSKLISDNATEAAIAYMRTQWQELSTLTEELILGPVDASDAGQVKELESLIAETAALMVQKPKASARDAFFETMRVWLQRQSVAKIPTSLESAFVKNSLSFSGTLRTAMTELAESLLRSSESGALIPAPLEIESLPGPSLLQKMASSLAAKAVQTALVQKDQCMRNVVDVSSALGIEPLDEHSLDRWCSLALNCLCSETHQTEETMLCAVCEVLIPPLVKMNSAETNKSAQKLLEKSAKQRFKSILKTCPKPPPSDSQLVESIRSACMAVQKEWVNITSVVEKVLRGKDIHDTDVEIQLAVGLAVGRTYFSRGYRAITLEKLVGMELKKHSGMKEQAVWDPAANTTKKGGGLLAFNPYEAELVEENLEISKATHARVKDNTDTGKENLKSTQEILSSMSAAEAELPSSRRAFASMRFDGVVTAHAEQLRAAMRSKGADLQIVNKEGGGDIERAAMGGVLAADYFIVFGSAKYGECTDNSTSSYYESKVALNQKKKIILIRMIPFDAEFEFQQGKLLFGSDKLELVWILGTPMPAELPGQVLDAMGLTSGGEEAVSSVESSEFEKPLAQEPVSSEGRTPGLGRASTARLAGGLTGALKDSDQPEKLIPDKPDDKAYNDLVLFFTEYDVPPTKAEQFSRLILNKGFDKVISLYEYATCEEEYGMDEFRECLKEMGIPKRLDQELVIGTLRKYSLKFH